MKYSFNENKIFIRANQGRSIPVSDCVWNIWEIVHGGRNVLKIEH